jgi:neutral trehalase
LRDIEDIFKKVKEIICVLKCVHGKKTFKDMKDIFKKVNSKEQNLIIEKEAFGQERKNKFKQRKILNSKVLKLWL